MAKTTRIVRFHETGEPEVMKYEEVPIPEPGAGEIRIKVEAIGAGFGEALYRQGQYVQKTVLPSKLGNNAVGTVEAVGFDVTNPKVGERVAIIPSFEMNQYGVYGEHAIVPAFSAAPYIESLSLVENAAIWIQIITAYVALIYYGKIDTNDFVLITPASGGVGQAAIQTVKKAGATSIATTRSREKTDMLRERGADHVIVTSEEDIEERIKEITEGKGVRIVFNALTGSIMETLVSVTQPGGTIFQYGGIGGKDTLLPYPQLIAAGIKIQGYTLYELTYHPENLPALKDYVVSGIEEGFYTANIDRTFDFDQLIEVHHYLEAGNTSGSVVVIV